MRINLLGKGFVDNDGLPSVVADWKLVCKNSNNWSIQLEECEDYSTWTESFVATHNFLGSVSGNNLGEINLFPNQGIKEEDLIKAFNEDIELTLDDFDTWDI